MKHGLEIIEVKGREIIDSGGNPAIESEVILDNGAHGRASVSMEGRSPCESGATEYINEILSEVILFEDASDQRYIDCLLVEAENINWSKSSVPEAVLATSMAAARAAGAGLMLPLYRYLGGITTSRLPVPMISMLGGGFCEDNSLDFQSFMIFPARMESFLAGLRICTEVYNTLKKLLSISGHSTAAGGEGAFVPNFKNAEEALQYLVDAIKLSGYKPGTDIKIAIHAAAGNLYDKERDLYVFPGESRMNGVLTTRTRKEMIEYYANLTTVFPIYSIEDGLWEEDWDGNQCLMKVLGHRIQLVGGALFKADIHRLEKGIQYGAANGICIKMNQAGTVTATLDVLEAAREAGLKTILSHLSAETEDPFIADFASAVNVGQIKAGAPCRSERTAKYNELLRIEELF